MEMKARGTALFKLAVKIANAEGVRNQYGMLADSEDGQLSIQTQYYNGQQHARITESHKLGGLSVAVGADGEIDARYPSLVKWAEEAVNNWK